MTGVLTDPLLSLGELDVVEEPAVVGAGAPLPSLAFDAGVTTSSLPLLEPMK